MNERNHNLPDNPFPHLPISLLGHTVVRAVLKHERYEATEDQTRFIAAYDDTFVHGVLRGLRGALRSASGAVAEDFEAVIREAGDMSADLERKYRRSRSPNMTQWLGRAADATLREFSEVYARNVAQNYEDIKRIAVYEPWRESATGRAVRIETRAPDPHAA